MSPKPRHRRHTVESAKPDARPISWLRRYEVVFTTVGAVALSIAAIMVSIASYQVSRSQAMDTHSQAESAEAQTRIANLQYRLAAAEAQPRFDIATTTSKSTGDVIKWRISNKGSPVIITGIHEYSFLVLSGTSEDSSEDSTDTGRVALPMHRYIRTILPESTSGQDWVASRWYPNLDGLTNLADQIPEENPAFVDMQTVVLFVIDYRDIFGTNRTQHYLTDEWGTIPVSAAIARRAIAEQDYMYEREMLIYPDENRYSDIADWIVALKRSNHESAGWLPDSDYESF